MADVFDRLVGVWTFEGHSLPDDGKPPRTGEETITRHGVWTVIESSDGARFQLALDPATGRVAGDFVHRRTRPCGPMTASSPATS